MNEDIGLLADIVENPLDNTPRLIYADWLEERGQPNDAARAEFIRLQIDHFHRRSNPRTQRRVHRLIAHNGRRWSRSLRPVLSRPIWRRGFVEQATVYTEVFLERAHELLALAPLRHLHFRQVRGRFASLCRCPHLGRLDGVSLQNARLSAQDLQAMATSPYLETLQELDLGGNELDTPEGVRQWFGRMPELTNLGLEKVGLTGDRLAALVPVLPGHLTGLNLSGNRLGDECIPVLETLSLQRLGLNGTQIGIDGLCRLLDSMPSLCWVGLGPQPQAVREKLAQQYPSVQFDFRCLVEFPS